jgi:hypothetical protein
MRELQMLAGAFEHCWSIQASLTFPRLFPRRTGSGTRSNPSGLAANRRRYYQLDWQRITETQLMGMTPDRITTEEVDGLLLSRFSELRQSGSTKRYVFVARSIWKQISQTTSFI